MNAKAFLDAAAGHIGNRAATYDKPEGERSMAAAVTAFNAITKRNLREGEGWLLLQLLKDVRLFTAPDFHRDSAEDCVAYAALKAESMDSNLLGPLPAKQLFQCEHCKQVFNRSSDLTEHYVSTGHIFIHDNKEASK